MSYTIVVIHFFFIISLSLYSLVLQARRGEIDIGAAVGVGSGGVSPPVETFFPILSIPRLDFQ